MILFYFGAKPTEFSSQEGLFVLLADTLKSLNGAEATLFLDSRHTKVLQKSQELIEWPHIKVVVVGLLGKTKTYENPSKISASLFSRGISHFNRFLWTNPLTILIRAKRSFDQLASFVLFYTFLQLVSHKKFFQIGTLLILLIILRYLKRTLTFQKTRDKYQRLKRKLLSWRIARHLNQPFINFLYSKEQRKLARKLSTSHNCEDFFVPHLFAGELVETLRRRGRFVRVVFPDLVNREYPQYFHADQNFEISVKKSCEFASVIFSYSNYVKNKHISFEHRSKVIVNNHGWLLPETYTDFDINKLVRNISSQNWSNPVPIFLNSHWSIIVPTIDRPYKNIISAIKAVEKLNRERYLDVKLYLTTPVISDENINYIIENRLHNLIIWTPNLSTSELESFIHDANLVLHPSLFEGGAIFNVMRASNQNTPFLVHASPTAVEWLESGKELISDNQNFGSNFPYLHGLTNALDVEILATDIANTIINSVESIEVQKQLVSPIRGHTIQSASKTYTERFK